MKWETPAGECPVGEEVTKSKNFFNYISNFFKKPKSFYFDISNIFEVIGMDMKYFSIAVALTTVVAVVFLAVAIGATSAQVLILS